MIDIKEDMMEIAGELVRGLGRTEAEGADWMGTATEDPEQNSFPLIVVTPISQGGYLVSSPIVPGLMTTGRTVGETLENLRKALGALLEMYDYANNPLPEKFEQSQAKADYVNAS